MEDSSSRPLGQTKKLKRLTQDDVQDSDGEDKPRQQPVPKKQSKPKRQSKSKEKQPRKRSTKKKKHDPPSEVIIEQKSSEQLPRQINKIAASPTKVTQELEEDKRARLYKSSEESDEEGVLGFVGLQEAEKKPRQKRAKKEKKQIRTSNRFFKDENFHCGSFDYSAEADTADAECLELKIEIKEVKSTKTVDFFNKKSGAIKKMKPTVQDVSASRQHQVNRACIGQTEIKRLVSRESSQADSDQFDIELQVPRVNVGKKNQIVDNTLFVKRFTDKPSQKETVPIQEEKQKIRKKVSRDEYMREIDESIKNRRAQSISAKDISASFVMSSLDDLNVGGGLIAEINETSEKDAIQSNNVSLAGKNNSQPITKPVVSELTPQTVTFQEITPSVVTGQKNEETPSLPRPKQPEKQSIVSQQVNKQNGKQTQQPNPLMRFFDDEAEESGKDKLSGSENEEGDVPDLIDDNVDYNYNNENLAYQKFLEDEFKRDEELVRRITTKQYPIKKKIQYDANDSRKARMQDIKDLIRRRSDESKEGCSNQQLPPLLIGNECNEPEVEIDLNSQMRMELAAKQNRPFCRWSFVQPKKPTTAGVPNGKRHSLLSVATGDTAITNFKNRPKKEPQKFVAAALHKFLQTPSQHE